MLLKLEVVQSLLQTVANKGKMHYKKKGGGIYRLFVPKNAIFFYALVHPVHFTSFPDVVNEMSLHPYLPEKVATIQ